MKISFKLILIFYFILFITPAQANVEGQIEIDYKGKVQTVFYNLYLPEAPNDSNLPVVVCVGGLPMIDGIPSHTDTRDCMSSDWIKFADDNKIAILGVGYLFVWDDWESKKSFQYAKVWSGQALLNILDLLTVENSINKNKLAMFGISAGAQFSVRFAQMRPDLVDAVTAHAAGGYDLPTEAIPTKFLITVGELDNKEVSRLEFAKMFVARSKELGIDATLKVIPNVAHRQTAEQNNLSRKFILKNLK